jgi:hypothetical protein
MTVSKFGVGWKSVKSVCGKVANLSVKSVKNRSVKSVRLEKPLPPTEPKKIRNKKIMSPTVHHLVGVGQKSVGVNRKSVSR